jgi:RNA polymerase sigma-70 factor, ECF subfamily
VRPPGIEPAVARPASADTAEQRLVSAIKAGDEAAFTKLVRLHSPSMLRLAQLIVGRPALAEEVVQETWIAVLAGVDRFQRRSSLKTWIFRILVNTAKTRATREARTIVFSALDDSSASEPSVDPDRFRGPDDKWPGGWVSSPQRFDSVPEDQLLAKETRAVIERTLDGLPAAQRMVVTMRDVEGWSADEVCEALGLSAANQRVLLHRGRSKVRAALEAHLALG